MNEQPYRVTSEEIASLAGALGVVLSTDVIECYREAVDSQLASLHDFLLTDLPEGPPASRFQERGGVRRPTADEDPYRAWRWRCYVRGADEGLLAGTTVGLKDHIAVSGVPLTFGSEDLPEVRPNFDATVVDRSLSCGAVVTGKNTMNGPFGGVVQALNPHNVAHVTGGSSSGSAAAVSASDVALAFGGDQGGSVRIPAAYCGILGLKPTFGLVSHFGVSFGADQSLDHVGPMARHTEVLARALQAVAGWDPLDPRQDRTIPSSIDVLSDLETGIRGLRVGVLAEGFEEPIDEGVRSGVLNCLDQLAALGARVVNVSVPEHRSVNSAAFALMVEGNRAALDTGMYGIWAKTFYPSELSDMLGRVVAMQARLLQPSIIANEILSGLCRARFGGSVYAKAQNVRKIFQSAYDRALADVDVLVMPTTPDVAPKIGDQGPAGDEVGLVRDGLHRVGVIAARMRNTLPFNYTGHPALALPCGKIGTLPFGMQVVGRALEDGLLLRVAWAFEHAVAWDTLITPGDGRPTHITAS